MKSLDSTKPDQNTVPQNFNNSQSHTSSIVTPKDLQVSQVLFTLRWRLMTQILLALPVLSLFVCLITSLIFHADHINNTICKVYNFLPSISAVTGVSPQRYLWRVCVALHISPRLLVALVAKEFYSSMATRVPAIHRPVYKGLVTLAFCLNLTELATLCGVTYISNKENYPVHEKLFMLFMIASLVYMVCVVRLLTTVRHALSPALLRSLSHKRWLLGTKIGATLGLLFFFWRHRVHCQPKAFSWFSLCEYVIATCNMLYHVSVALDFSEEHLIVGHIVTSSPSVSLTTPDSSMVSSFTVNSLNEFSNAVDKTPDADFIVDEMNYTSNRKEFFKENLNEEFVPGLTILSSLNDTEPKNTSIEANFSPIKQVLNTIHENPEGIGHRNPFNKNVNSSSQDQTNRIVEHSKELGQNNISNTNQIRGVDTNIRETSRDTCMETTIPPEDIFPEPSANQASINRKVAPSNVDKTHSE